MQKIPTYQTASSKWKTSIVLADLTINLELHWNSRSEAWYMDIFDLENGYALTGVKLVPDWLLIRQFRAYMPNLNGDFIIIKEDAGIGDRVTYDNLNNGYDLYFYNTEEAEQWEDDNGVG